MYTENQPLMQYPGAGQFNQQQMLPGMGQAQSAQQQFQQQQPIMVNVSIRDDISCSQIYCGCAPPQFQKCQCICGCITACSGGGGLISGTICCCYGCNRPDCSSVLCAGCVMDMTTPCLYGIISGCCVGMKMALCCGCN